MNKKRLARTLIDLADILDVVARFLLIVIYTWACGWGLEYSFEYWISYSQGQPVDLPSALFYLIGGFSAGLSILAGLITLLCSYVM